MTAIIQNLSEIEVEIDDLEAFSMVAIAKFQGQSGGSISITFINDDEMRRVNNEFRGIDSTTDVLSFPFEAEEFEDDQNLGDIIISGEQAEKQANENGLSLEMEIKQLILHGFLHLCGYDHETDDGEMNSLELELRDKLNINR